MPLSNFERLIQLADEVFSVKNDPDQLDVNQEIIEHLQRIHPDSVSEYEEGNGPLAWVLLIPTTELLMNRFLKKEICEKELFSLTPIGVSYEAIYLCSALILEEYRRKGIVKNLTMHAIDQIQKEHPIKCLFVWAFSKEGEACAANLSQNLSLPLYKRQ